MSHREHAIKSQVGVTDFAYSMLNGWWLVRAAEGAIYRATMEEQIREVSEWAPVEGESGPLPAPGSRYCFQQYFQVHWSPSETQLW
jgi:hypothetical protein